MAVFRKIIMLLLSALLLAQLPACNSNKIACPTYADSFPEKKSKKGKQKPPMQKSSKAKSSVLPPGYKAKKQKAD